MEGRWGVLAGGNVSLSLVDLWLGRQRLFFGGGGGCIDGWHIIGLLIAAPQNWIASRGLWSVRIWLMSPTPLPSPDSSPLSGPGRGFLHHHPPTLHHPLWVPTVSGEEAAPGFVTALCSPLLSSLPAVPLASPKSPSTHFSAIYLPHATNIHKINLQMFISKQTSVSAAENNWMSLCKLFLFGSTLCLFFPPSPLSGLFIISKLEIQKSAARGRSESQLPDWLCLAGWFLGLWNGATQWHNAHQLCVSSAFLTKPALNDFHENYGPCTKPEKTARGATCIQVTDLTWWVCLVIVPLLETS